MGETASVIWREYERALEGLRRADLFGRAEKCYEFVLGDQWKGLKTVSLEERPVQLNFLEPLMRQKTALVGQNTMSIRYGSMNVDSDRQKLVAVCDKLTAFAGATWERLKLDRELWSVLQNAFISGDQFAYYYQDPAAEGLKIEMRLLDTTDVLLADEQNEDIQAQPYILIRQRRYLADVVREARENGLSAQQLRLIAPDDDDIRPERDGDGNELQKVTSILKMYKKGGVVHFQRATRAVVYQGERAISADALEVDDEGEVTTKSYALTLYPLAQYSWRRQKGSARGIGEVWDKIPAQISVNKNYFRFEAAVKSAAFPHLAYLRNALDPSGAEKLSIPGSVLELRGEGGLAVNQILQYLQPGQISPYAASITGDLIDRVQALSGAGDDLENVDPEKASGAAITAAREARALNVNAQVAACRQFIEDTALVWFDMAKAYSPGGLEVVMTGEDGEKRPEVIPAGELERLKIEVRVDVSPRDPYSKLAHELGLKELFQAGAIEFEEYVEALDEDSSIPKGKLQEILRKRSAGGARGPAPAPGDLRQLGDAALEQHIANLEMQMGGEAVGMPGTPQH